MIKNMDDHLLEKINEVETLHWWWEGRRQLVKILLGKKKYETILDVGYGTGEMMTYLKSAFPKARLFGIDTSSRAINYARERGHKNIIKANAMRLPYKNNYFDAVLFLDVLEHIKDDQRCINEAKRVLK